MYSQKKVNLKVTNVKRDVRHPRSNLQPFYTVIQIYVVFIRKKKSKFMQDRKYINIEQ